MQQPAQDTGDGTLADTMRSGGVADVDRAVDSVLKTVDSEVFANADRNPEHSRMAGRPPRPPPPNTPPEMGRLVDAETVAAAERAQARAAAKREARRLRAAAQADSGADHRASSKDSRHADRGQATAVYSEATPLGEPTDGEYVTHISLPFSGAVALAGLVLLGIRVGRGEAKKESSSTAAMNALVQERIDGHAAAQTSDPETGESSAQRVRAARAQARTPAHHSCLLGKLSNMYALPRLRLRSGAQHAGVVYSALVPASQERACRRRQQQVEHVAVMAREAQHADFDSVHVALLGSQP
jgi:hypothetical protein